jgi:hypothetical protein
VLTHDDQDRGWTLAYQPALIEQEDAGDVPVYHLDRWHYFDDFIREEMLDQKGFVWRGQGDDSWRLRSSLDRLLRDKGLVPGSPIAGEIRKSHLERFKLACRGRRGMNPRTIEEEDDWWALGQHHDLKTPLLDWTVSPFVAVYFALVTDEQAERCSVVGLSRPEVERANKTLTEQHESDLKEHWKRREKPNLLPPVLEFLEPMVDDNYRLVSQGGLFSRAPDGMDVEEWLVENLKPITKERFLKITIPTSDRELALRSLNRMNINHLSLFPDLKGASEYTNVDLLIDGY